MSNFATQGMPNFQTPVVDENGRINIVWYLFFQSLWQKSGMAASLYNIGVLETQTQTWGEVIPTSDNVTLAAFQTSQNLWDLYAYSVVNGAVWGRVTMDPIIR